jgi:hypothetical protein
VTQIVAQKRLNFRGLENILWFFQPLEMDFGRSNKTLTPKEKNTSRVYTHHYFPLSIPASRPHFLSFEPSFCNMADTTLSYCTSNDPSFLQKGCTLCSTPPKSECEWVIVITDSSQSYGPDDLRSYVLHVVPLDCECLAQLNRDLLGTCMTSRCHAQLKREAIQLCLDSHCRWYRSTLAREATREEKGFISSYAHLLNLPALKESFVDLLESGVEEDLAGGYENVIEEIDKAILDDGHIKPAKRD